MTLTIHKEEDSQRQLLLTVEVEEARVQKAMRQTAKKLAREYNFPGFRRGKAPYRIIVNRVGEAALRADTVEEMVPDIFDEAITDIKDEEIYGRPELTNMEIEPLVLNFTIPLQPVVTLGDYRVLRQEVAPVEISDKAIDEALERIREKYQELEEVERPLAEGDMATLSGTGKLVVAEEEAEAKEEEPEATEEESTTEDVAEELDRLIFAEDRIDLPMDPNRIFAGTPFVENLMGLTAGEETTFNFTFPADYENEDLAGKEATFTLTLLNVQSRSLPELNDDLAKQEGEYETLDELREATYKNLQEAATARAKEELIDEMTDKLLEEATLVYPPAAVEMEIDQMVENFKNQAQRAGWEWEDFLRLQGMDEAAMRANFQETAVERLSRGLVMREFILNEKIEVNAEDVDAIIETKIARFEDENLRNGMRDYYRTGYGFDTISSEVLHDKVYDRVKAIFTGVAPELSELEDEEPANDEEE
ncbi:MAG: trigger factor [Chloroflexota bacterium]